MLKEQIPWYEKSECVVLSCVIHGIILLLLSLHQEDFSHKSHTPLLHPQKSILYQKPPIPSQQTQTLIDPMTAELINPACILYKPGGSQKKASSASQSSKTHEHIKASLEGDLTGDTFKDSGTQDSKQKETTPSAPEKIVENKTEQKTHYSEKTSTTQSSSSTIPTIATITHSTFLHANEPLATEKLSKNTFHKTDGTASVQEEKAITLKADKLFDGNTLSEKPETGDGTRKRKLTLSDLFKNLSTLPLYTVNDESSDGDGDGAPAVIVQGDIRYHSFITGIVEHINNTSKHRHGDNIIRGLIQTGTIKQNLKLSITLDKNGKVLDARTLISSGCPQLDSFWVTTAYEASPFAPLPAHFKRDMVRVELVTQL